jgi:uncharacterized protein
MKIAHGSVFYAHPFRLHKGDDLREAIEAKVKEGGFSAASVVTCVGSVQRIDIRLADESLPGPLEGPFEIVSLVGTLGRGGSHLHGAFADAKGNVIGGHIRPGCVIHTTAEVVLGVMPALVFDRTFDSNTGFDELEVSPAKQ